MTNRANQLLRKKKTCEIAAEEERLRKLIVAGLLAGTVLPFAPAAYAQEGAEADSSGEIIVTARRREESISKVPIAITAIGGEELAKRAIYNENDLQSAVPGLVIRQ